MPWVPTLQKKNNSLACTPMATWPKQKSSTLTPAATRRIRISYTIGPLTRGLRDSMHCTLTREGQGKDLRAPGNPRRLNEVCENLRTDRHTDVPGSQG